MSNTAARKGRSPEAPASAAPGSEDSAARSFSSLTSAGSSAFISQAPSSRPRNGCRLTLRCIREQLHAIGLSPSRRAVSRVSRVLPIPPGPITHTARAPAGSTSASGTASVTAVSIDAIGFGASHSMAENSAVRLTNGLVRSRQVRPRGVGSTARTANTSIGRETPRRGWVPKDSVSNHGHTRSWVVSLITTVSGSASCWMRAASLAVEPVMPSATTTRSVCTEMRTCSGAPVGPGRRISRTRSIIRRPHSTPRRASSSSTCG